MRLKESEVIKTLENVSLLIVNGSDDQIVELKEAKINYEAAKEPKQLVVIESTNHTFQDKEKETMEKTTSWLTKTKI